MDTNGGIGGEDVVEVIVRMMEREVGTYKDRGPKMGQSMVGELIRHEGDKYLTTVWQTLERFLGPYFLVYTMQNQT